MTAQAAGQAADKRRLAAAKVANQLDNFAAAKPLPETLP